jgi:hypothetical protein
LLTCKTWEFPRMKAEPPEVPPVDMSSEAIDERFRMVEALRKLCVSLKEAGEQARQRKNLAADETLQSTDPVQALAGNA